MELDIIKTAVHEALTERDRLDHDKHRAHHDFVAHLIDRHSRRQKRLDKIREQVGGWAVITFLTGLGYLAWSAFVAVMKKMGAH